MRRLCLFRGCCATRFDLGGFQPPAKISRHACDELGHTQALFPGGLRDEGYFLLGGQDPNPEHEPPPEFGPPLSPGFKVQGATRLEAAAGKASGGLEPTESGKVALPKFQFLHRQRLGSAPGPGRDNAANKANGWKARSLGTAVRMLLGIAAGGLADSRFGSEAMP